MIYTTLSMVVALAAVAAVSYSSAIDPSPSQPDLTSLAIGYGSEELPKGSYALEVSEGLDTLEGKADAINGSSPACRLLFRGQYIREAVWYKVLIHNQSWRGSSLITLVKAYEVGPSQNATARIIAGGVFFRYVTVQLRSDFARGFNIILEIYGW